jgi:mono/diheme cytochrome c family protein
MDKLFMMLKLPLRTIFIAAAFSLAACGGQTGASPDGANAAESLYQAKCASCHGARGETREIGGREIPGLKSVRAIAYTDERLAQWIREGGVGMPPYRNQLTDEQIRELVRFIRQDLQGKKETQ